MMLRRRFTRQARPPTGYATLPSGAWNAAVTLCPPRIDPQRGVSGDRDELRCCDPKSVAACQLGRNRLKRFLQVSVLGREQNSIAGQGGERPASPARLPHPRADGRGTTLRRNAWPWAAEPGSAGLDIAAKRRTLRSAAPMRSIGGLRNQGTARTPGRRGPGQCNSSSWPGGDGRGHHVTAGRFPRGRGRLRLRPVGYRNAGSPRRRWRRCGRAVWPSQGAEVWPAAHRCRRCR